MADAKQPHDAHGSRYHDSLRGGGGRATYAHARPLCALPDCRLTVREAVHKIAKLGGFLGRRHDGEPGITTLWRGWQRHSNFTLMWSLATEGKFTGNSEGLARGQGKVKSRALAGLRFDPDAPTVLLDDLLANGKADPAARVLMARVQAVKDLK